MNTSTGASPPTDLTAVQVDTTSLEVMWRPPTPLGTITGYTVTYSGITTGSVSVDGGLTDNLLLRGLQNGYSYAISIVATSNIGLPSLRVATLNLVGLGKSVEDVHAVCSHVSFLW